MPEHLRRRLRELGVVRGVRKLAMLPTRRRIAIEDLAPGRFHTTSHGQCFVAEATYPPDHLHGDLPLSAFLDLPAEIVAQVARDGALAGVNLRRACFLDTETTGLSGGAGTMAFIVGLGYFDETGFRLRQYFLRDPGDEPAMVEALAETLPEFEALVSFNGRGFDVPILENRFILARIPPPTAGVPHLDLLHPARRLWRHRLPSCALTALEREVLGVQREQDDVPGGLIPYLYRDYLRTGDAREMKRVLYHNAVDILSLVTLAAHLGRIFADPWAEAEHERNESLSGAEFYGLGRWYEAENKLAEAERAYRVALRLCSGQAIGTDHTFDLHAKALRDLGYLLKRAGRRHEAFACWQQLALETRDDALAHVELAKYFEWHVGDLALAAGWTRTALAQVENWPTGTRRDDALAELRHRLARLERKIDA
ncbi:MAG: ribonuclease H-like domain-containing protein [Anaerolineae bacterium]|nr:ribonuclease H-like domain-containing protein [Anaerolineae bacterium]